MSTRSKIKWLDEPEKKNYAAALGYLSLIYRQDKAGDLVERGAGNW